MRAACGVIMVCLVRNFLADYGTGSLRLSFPPPPLRSGGDEGGFFSCKMNGLYRELQAFIRCLRAPTHDGIFAFCRTAPGSVGRADPGRALSPRDTRSSDGRGPAPAVLDAGAGDLARAPACLAGGGALVFVQRRREAAFCSGEEVSPGVRLDTVERDRIVIVRNGVREAVFMKDADGAAAAAVPPIVQSVGTDRQDR